MILRPVRKIFTLLTLMVFIGSGLYLMSHRPTLKKGLVSKEEAIRTVAFQKLSSLSDLKKRQIIPFLISSLRDQDPRISNRAQEALLAIGPSTVVPLINTLNDQDAYVRLCAVATLGRLQRFSISSIPNLVDALNDPHPLVREEAAYALGEIGPPAQDAVPMLRESIQKDQSDSVREVAKEAIQKINSIEKDTKKIGWNPAGSPAVPLLNTRLPQTTASAGYPPGLGVTSAIAPLSHSS